MTNTAITSMAADMIDAGYPAAAARLLRLEADRVEGALVTEALTFELGYLRNQISGSPWVSVEPFEGEDGPTWIPKGPTHAALTGGGQARAEEMNKGSRAWLVRAHPRTIRLVELDELPALDALREGRRP